MLRWMSRKFTGHRPRCAIPLSGLQRIRMSFFSGNPFQWNSRNGLQRLGWKRRSIQSDEEMFEAAVTIKQCQRQTVKDGQSATYGQRHCVIDAERLPNKRKTPATSALDPESEPLAPKVSPAVPRHGRQSNQLTSVRSKFPIGKKLQLNRRHRYVLLDIKGHRDVITQSQQEATIRDHYKFRR